MVATSSTQGRQCQVARAQKGGRRENPIRQGVLSHHARLPPANQTHGAVHGELCRLIANHLAEKSSLCSALANPGVVPRVQAEHNVRIPDLAVTCSDL
ncbi:MAG: hypothetical protein DLM68_15935 [Hyphomicrobiales bacterium]|nr:MAG: hypothetical protein DLM68_15935 [Hyphomicrobiales bacterium]